MSSPADLVIDMVRGARRADEAVQQYAASMAQCLRGKLRHCDASDLAALKKELRSFNIHTRTWRNP